MVDSILILTHLDDGAPLAPHLSEMEAAHPGVPVHLAYDDLRRWSRREQWRQCDATLLRWWRQNRDQVAGDVIAVAEWDVLALSSLPDLPDDLDVAFANVRPLESGPARAALLGQWQPPVGPLVGWPFAVVLIRRAVLDELTSGAWNADFRVSVHAEARLATLAKAAGFRVGTVELPHIEAGPPPEGTSSGIWHPVKE